MAAEGPSQGLLVAVGLVGLVVGITAATGGFLVRVAQVGLVYSWGDTLRIAAIFSLIGGMLALSQHEAGVPIVIGACVTSVAVVGTVLAGLHLKISRMTDDYPVRGVLFIITGVLALLGVVLGLAALRGRANAAFGVPVALLSVISLGMTAALLHLDKTRHAEQVRPFVGYAFIAVLSIVCSFTGRFGVFAASVAAASIVSSFIDSLEISSLREAAAAGDIVALALTIMLGAAALGAASRRHQEAAAFDVSRGGETPFAAPTPGAWASDPSRGPATVAVPTQRSTGQIPVAAMPTSAFASTADELLSGHPLIAPYEPTTAVPIHDVPAYDARDADIGAISTVGQWAPDPYHRHRFRYWDGAQWTHHVQDDGVAAIDPV